MESSWRNMTETPCKEEGLASEAMSSAGFVNKAKLKRYKV